MNHKTKIVVLTFAFILMILSFIAVAHFEIFIGVMLFLWSTNIFNNTL